jgi:hypothetical protein
MSEGRAPTWIFFSDLPLKIEVKLPVYKFQVTIPCQILKVWFENDIILQYEFVYIS